jgi:hypothetical protein
MPRASRVYVRAGTRACPRAGVLPHPLSLPDVWVPHLVGVLLGTLMLVTTRERKL